MINKPQISGTVEIKPERSSFCVPVAGIYTLQLSACHIFDKPSYEVSVPQETPLTATAVKFLVSVNVRFNDGKPQLENFRLTVKSENEERVVSVCGSIISLTFHICCHTFHADS